MCNEFDKIKFPNEQNSFNVSPKLEVINILKQELLNTRENLTIYQYFRDDDCKWVDGIGFIDFKFNENMPND